jgi:CBS-domain-containing membrane protein
MSDSESQKRSQILGRLGVGDHLFDPKFYRNRSRYLYQCAFVAITVLIVLLVLDAVYQSVLIAALGASSMVAFSAPNMRASRPRCMIGGYAAGITIGCSISLLVASGDYAWLSADLVRILAGAFATGLVMFVMVTTDTEHPPAAALALGFVLNDWNFMTVLGVLSGIVLIVVIKESVRSRLVDLL